MTAFDAGLLQKSKAFFTGGFLSVIHTQGAFEAVVFLLVSLLVDAAAIAASAAAVLVLTSRLRLTTAARHIAVFLGAVAPFVLADFVSYRLAAYFGDAFDLSLMFELTGRRPEEFLAVGSWQIVQTLTVVVAAFGALALLLWLVNRFTSGAPTAMPLRVRRIGTALLAVLVAGLFTAVVAGVASETFEDGLRRKPSGWLFEGIAATLTDFDRDGFGIVGGMRDPDLFNASIYPWAIDVPANGVDEDGVGGDLPPGARYEEGHQQPAAWRQRPNVVLFVLESFRADAVDRQLNGKPVTPVLDKLAVDGISSLRAYSHNGYTAQSRFHLMSGSLAGLRNGTSLIDDFAAHGYETAYFSAQDESFGGESLGVGFDRASVRYDARVDRDRRYSTFTTAGSLAVSYATLEERLAAFLVHRDTSRPLFLYVNFHDTHYPYHHPEIIPLVSNAVLPQSRIGPAEREGLQDMYFNTAANVDRAIGWVLNKVGTGLATPPAVIVLADHGESLFDGNFLGHGYALNDVQTRIPMIVKGLPMRIEEPFGQVDLRDALGAALSADWSLGTQPRLAADPSKLVFQYLGNINRPRQIGFVDASGRRTIYDFRSMAVETGTVPAWRPPSGLTGTDRDRFLELIRTWERMMLARSGR
jgi:glucan phosphoethanolaminetransferase (alkaline phosphatase superfamily)